jgi:hypothetical protein
MQMKTNNKRRYDHKKLARSSSLKKKIALHLAQERYHKRDTPIDVVELLAFGGRPFVSYSDKDLIKLIDESYSSKFKEIEEINKEYEDSSLKGWMREGLKNKIELIEKEISKMQPIMDELIEEAFSE